MQAIDDIAQAMNSAPLRPANLLTGSVSATPIVPAASHGAELTIQARQWHLQTILVIRTDGKIEVWLAEITTQTKPVDIPLLSLASD